MEDQSGARLRRCRGSSPTERHDAVHQDRQVIPFYPAMTSHASDAASASYAGARFAAGPARGSKPDRGSKPARGFKGSKRRIPRVSSNPHEAEAGTSPSGGAIQQAGEVRSTAIESLRALAALAVLEGHVFGQVHSYGAGDFSSFFNRALFGGGFGVFLFFALTGYLLYRPFARRDFGGGRALRYGQYAANRAFRILPLYYVVLVVYVIAFDHGGSFSTLWRSAIFFENFYPGTLSHVDGVMWSLVVEVQFYVLLPFLAAGLRRFAGGSLRLAAIAVGAIGVLSELFRVTTVTLAHSVDPRWEYSLPTTFVFFTSGMLIALTQTARTESRPSWLRGLVARGDAWIIAGIALWCAAVWRYDLDVLLVPASFLVVGSVVLPASRGIAARVLEWRPLATLGLASYSLYLWHFPIVEHLDLGPGLAHSYVGMLAVMVPLCCAVALLSYATVEAPFLRFRRSWSAAARTRSARTVVPSPRSESA